MVVISSKGGAAQHSGGDLGQYEYVEERGHYVQSCTEMNSEKYQPRYLYPDEDGVWRVSSTPGEKEKRCWLKNPTASKTVPVSGWWYWDGKEWQDDDPSLTVTSGPLPPLPRQFTVTGIGGAAVKLKKCLGVFTKTERWWRGRPVYVNTKGTLLLHGTFFWLIGQPKLGYYGLRGFRSHQSPASEKNWSYWTGSKYKPACIAVIGSG